MAASNETSDSRFERLREGVSGLGGRSSGEPVARWLMIAGGALMALGLAVIVLGWSGAAHTPYVFEQMPYLISGGFLGAAIAIIGGLLYFAYWMTRSLEEARAAAARTQDALARIEDLLGARTIPQSNGHGPTQKTSATKPFVKTVRGSMFHRVDCAVVAGRDGLVPVGAGGDGIEPCGVCDPLASV